MRKFFILSSIICSVMHVFAQGSLFAVTVVPLNPSTSDNVEIHVGVRFLQANNCMLEEQALEQIENSFVTQVTHCFAPLTGWTCERTDTFQLGQLPIGDYTFRVSLYSRTWPTCDPSGSNSPHDIMEISFTVSEGVGISESVVLATGIQPNPVIDMLHFSQPLTRPARIIDHIGQWVADLSQGAVEIDVSGLKAGLYLLDQGAVRTRFIKL